MPPDHTHDPAALSWVESANDRASDFPIQNLPHGVFRRRGSDEAWRGGVAIGDAVLDLAAVAAAGGLGEAAGPALAAAAAASLNGLMALGEAHWRALRHALFAALREGSADAARLRPALLPQSAIEHTLPATIGDFTDFYASVDHARNIGAMFRPDNPLLPNYAYVPIAYHGRSSSIAVSGQTVARPCGQRKAPDEPVPQFGPSARLDYELELGFFVGPGNPLGEAISIAAAERHVFGVCLLNDWSARDIQAWEYQPLGPFLAKNFATTISPWIVTMAALAPFRTAPAPHPERAPPLAYLDLADGASTAAIDIALAVDVQSAGMVAAGIAPQRVATSNFAYAFWTVAQMVAHHTANGCNLRPGDLIGTGTLSGPGADELGSIVELTRGGKAPLTLATGETRRFLADGDTVGLSGWCERPGARRIGFGRCAATIAPARVTPPR